MAKLSHDEIVRQLEAHGLRHRSVTFLTEGEYQPGDVDWNNKDVPHRNHLHSRINDVACVVTRDLQGSISLQKVAGITFPLILVHYDTGPNHQTHFVTQQMFTMVTEHSFENISPTRTRVTTTYTIAASRFWMLFFPLIRRLLAKNQALLMEEDSPMRERRGRLRSWGYTFRGDGGPRDIRATIPIAANNVLPPEPAPDAPTFAPVPLDRLTEGGCAFVGRSDHLGLMLRREGRSVLAYARLCPHEGAEMDPVAVVDRCQVCPWHGRELGPLAVLDLDAASPEAATPWHHLAVADGAVAVTVTDTGRGRTRAAASAEG